MRTRSSTRQIFAPSPFENPLLALPNNYFATTAKIGQHKNHVARMLNSTMWRRTIPYRQPFYATCLDLGEDDGVHCSQSGKISDRSEAGILLAIRQDFEC